VASTQSSLKPSAIPDETGADITVSDQLLLAVADHNPFALCALRETAHSDMVTQPSRPDLRGFPHDGSGIPIAISPAS